jgi:hypothetical protein
VSAAHPEAENPATAKADDHDPEDRADHHPVRVAVGLGAPGFARREAATRVLAADDWSLEEPG